MERGEGAWRYVIKRRVLSDGSMDIIYSKPYPSLPGVKMGRANELRHYDYAWWKDRYEVIDFWLEKTGYDWIAVHD